MVFNLIISGFGIIKKIRFFESIVNDFIRFFYFLETPKKLHHKNKKYYLQYHQANILQFLTFLRYKLQRVFSKKK